MQGQDKSIGVLNDYFIRHAQEKPTAEAIVFNGRRFTWEQYDRETDRVAAGLLKLGVKKGDRIGIYIPNWPEHLFVYMGCAKIGAIAVAIAWRFTPHEIKFIIGDAGISVLVMASGFLNMDFIKNIEAVRSELPTLKHVIILEKEKALSWMSPYEQLLDEPDAELTRAKAKVVPDDPLLLIYTSGTTGLPKAAVLMHRNAIAYVREEMDFIFQGGQTSLLNVPLNHIAGAVMSVAASLYAGSKLVLMDMYDPEKEFQLIQDEKVTILGGVPTHYAMRLRVTDPERFDLSSLRLAFVSGAPCPLEILTSVKRQFGLRMQNGYGLTEVSGAITSITPDDDDEKREVTVGRPLPGVDLAIMDSANSVLPPGQIGEIVIKGDVVMKGYWNRPDEDKKVFDEKGYLHTGDIGKLDEDGYLVIVGRKKEMFIRGGENVYPPEIENAIAQHPDVFMVAVVGRPDPLMGEVGRAYIIPKPGKNLTADDMKAFLKNRLSKYKTPADYIFRDQLPLSPLGKVQKLELYKEMKQEFEKKQ